MRKLLCTATMAALAVVLVACGGSNGSGDDEASTTSRADPAARGATVTTEPTIDQAAEAYRTLVTPLNTVIGEVNSDLQGATTFAEALGPLKRVQEAQQTFKDGLLRIRFPTTVQRQADDAVAAVVASQGQTDALIGRVEDGTATTTDLTAWGASLQALAGRVAVLRNALGLPQVE